MGRGYVDRRVSCPRGKMLGGSSSLNFFHYLRGNRKDYDDWADSGCTGWSYDEVLPYFKKCEDNVVPELAQNGYHGVGGPMTVSKANYRNEQFGPSVKALRTLGYKKNDPNGRKQTGYYESQSTIRDGQRCSTAKAYLVPAEHRPNLHIVIKAFVTKVVTENKNATGVIFQKNGSLYTVRARKEVIVSAGSYSTPHLLMLSGIGPAEVLNALNIPVVANLPVGSNLHDHFGIFVPFQMKASIPNQDEKLGDDRNILEYILHRSGPLCNPAGRAVHVMSDKHSNLSYDLPNIHIGISEFSAGDGLKNSGITRQIYDKVFAPYRNKTLGACRINVCHPRSRGYVKLKSSDPYEPPLIDPNYLDEEDDVVNFVKAVKLCMRIVNSSPMRRQLGAKLLKPRYPGCESKTGDDYIECQVRLLGTSFHHPVGSCKMGSMDDPTAVLDPTLKVKGVVGLRVVDASVMPSLPAANTNAPVIMVAEKAADLIKQDMDCSRCSRHPLRHQKD